MVKQLRTLREFTAPFWARGPILQLFMAIMCPAPEVHYFPEVLQMNDGGDVVLDWASDPTQVREDAPVLIILHGIGTAMPVPWQPRTLVLPQTLIK